MGWHWGILASSGGGAAGAYDLLETTLVTGTPSSVTFSNLNTYSQYKHLQIRQVLQGADGTNYNIQFNSDTGSNYAFHFLYGTGSTVASSAATSQTYIRGRKTNSSYGANVFSASIVDILDFNNTSKNTTTRHLDEGAGLIWFGSGFWNNTAAVTSITISPAAGTWNSGCRFSLYGVK